MRNITLFGAAGVVIIANLFALSHAAANRSGTPEAEVMLTEKELPYATFSRDEDNSGMSLRITRVWGVFPADPLTWLDRKELESLGFDCSKDPGAPQASEFYFRQRARRVFLALEYDGEAWAHFLNSGSSQKDLARPSHLLPIDADLAAGPLRSRHPDRKKVIIMRGVVSASVFFQDRNPRVQGLVSELPSSIHIPQPFSQQFKNHPANYRVHLAFGSSLEPWITAVETGPPR